MKCKCGIDLNFANGIEIIDESIILRVKCPCCGRSIMLHYKLDFTLFYNDEKIEEMNGIII